jgi:Cytochrome c554 and c-prime
MLVPIRQLVATIFLPCSLLLTQAAATAAANTAVDSVAYGKKGDFARPERLLQLAQDSQHDELLSPDDGQRPPATDELLPDAGPGGAAGQEDLLTEGGGKDGNDEDLLTGQPSKDEDLLTGQPSKEEDLLTGQPSKEEDLLTEEPGKAKAGGGEAAGEAPAATALEEHEKLFLENRYPSANTCATCHPKQYREWSVSQHAYAELSPIFMAMQNTINRLTNGTNGDFCIRCHNQVGMNLGESVYISNLDRNPTSREGITCVVCHRIDRNYGKVSGRLALIEGDLFDPVYGPTGDAELKRVIKSPEYRVVAKRGEPGRAIHADVVRFFPLVTPGFCGTCHDVTLLNGFRLEEAFSEFKRTATARKGITCQDCHMGKVQGRAAGFEEGPAADVGGVPTKPRTLTNHLFAGPDYSVIHPGLFPHNTRAAEFKTLREWLQFDVDAGWGTDQFEDNVPAGYEFPPAWRSIDDRYDGRDIIKEQLDRLAWAKERRLELLRNGFGIGDVTVDRLDDDGLDFTVEVRNLTDAPAPTGFDGERAMFLQVTLTDAEGRVMFVSGDRDPNGDLRDAHSLYVHNGELPLDEDLFSLQSKFLVRLNRGGEREQVLAVDVSSSALPFIRPETRATTIYGRPRGARKHKQTIEPLGHRLARYSVEPKQLSGHLPYTLNVKFISQMVPVNLLTEIQHVGFDYGMSPKQVADNLVARADTVWDRTWIIHPDGSIEETGAN